MSIELVLSRRLVAVVVIAATTALAGAPQSSPATGAGAGGADPSLSFGLSLDRAIYVNSDRYGTGAQLFARLTLRHSLAEPLRLDFPTPQVFDLVVCTGNGEIIRQWSSGKFFPQVLHTEVFHQGEKNYAVSISLTDASGAPLPTGSYFVEAWLTTTGSRSYDARVGFAIVQPQQSRGAPRRAVR